MSYYTKYRPQTVAELDLILVRESFSHILSSGSFSHAYLFTGPKGTGKTSSARILAKILNCDLNRHKIQETSDKKKEGKSLSEPCNTCDSCVRITHGDSLAVMEMDAASNRGIDDIRILKEKIGLRPVEGLYTVYIIDEVHMLTTEAFNALLKTLEEPPAHAVFILCTTDPQKIPDTVISRCTRILFQKAQSTEIAESLQKAIKGEHLQLDEGALDVISNNVDGSFRDGMKILEQLAQQEKKITRAMIDEVMGYGETYDASVLIASILNKDISAALDELQHKQDMGIDAGVFSKRLVELFRTQLLTQLSSGSQASEHLLLAARFSEVAIQVKQAVIPWLPIEIAVAEVCLGKQEIPVNPPMVGFEEHASDPASPRLHGTSKKLEVVAIEKKAEVQLDAYKGSIEEVKLKWQDVLNVLRPENHSLEALLRSARPAEYEAGWLTIEAFYKFHKEQLEQERYRKKLEACLSEILGGAIYIKFQLVGPQKLVTDKKIENISGSVEDDALVKAAEEIFG